MRIGLAVCLWAAGAGALLAQPADIVAANRQALADAMGRVLVRKLIDRPLAPTDVIGIDTDLNFDGFREAFVHVAANPCNGLDCGLFLFVLVGDEYREVLGAVPGARTASTNSALDRKRNFYLDLKFGAVEAGWDGNRYVDVTTLPRSVINGGAFISACMRRDNNDYEFGKAGVDIQSGRDIICRCKAERFADFGIPQADVDLYLGYLEIGTFDDAHSGPAFEALLTKASDIEMGCLVEHKWTSWIVLGIDPTSEPQKPLAFDAFLDACISQDTLIPNRMIGSADRALGLCGCLARRLAVKGFDQPMLDGLASYYRWEIAEPEVDAISTDILPLGDSESERCLSGMPKRSQ
jgi:hypothetical protein